METWDDVGACWDEVIRHINDFSILGSDSTIFMPSIPFDISICVSVWLSDYFVVIGGLSMQNAKISKDVIIVVFLKWDFSTLMKKFDDSLYAGTYVLLLF